MQSDSIIVFDYVELDKFRELIKNKTYRELLFKKFTEEYDLGTPSEIEAGIIEGLKFTDTIKILMNKLQIEKEAIVLEISIAREKHLIKESITKYLLYVGLIIAIFLYPLRIIYIVIN